MKIQSISLGSEDGVDAQSPKTHVVMVKISGPIDLENPVLKRARQLVESTGSLEAINSFDFAIQSNALSTEK